LQGAKHVKNSPRETLILLKSGPPPNRATEKSLNDSSIIYIFVSRSAQAWDQTEHKPTQETQHG
jgi:hypothetical protein